ncbi:heavy-metal-associated domain-containing protein [Flavobacterium sp. W20_MBD1_R3]|uniref:heavy-metal-associated domain-containing protein n=1 Tax=Flavobacterium sp. W20_MBD1_R3 TaxID=3240278 RepID=UPI003F8D9575
MKNINFKFIGIVCLVLITSMKSYSQISKADIIATGLTCSMCSNAINKQLKAMTEVDSVSTDLNTNTFTVYLKKNNVISPKVLRASVEKAGFFVGSMVLTMTFDNYKIADNLSFKKGEETFIFVGVKAKILNGDTKLKVVDKGFVTQKEFKKSLKTLSKYPSYVDENENNFHLKTI